MPQVTREAEVNKHLADAIKHMDEAANKLSTIAIVQDPHVIQVKVDRIRRYCDAIQRLLRS